LDLEVAKLNELRTGSIDRSLLTAHPLKVARVAFAVHPSNTVRRVSSDQLADILTGKIGNWREVGGADRPIVVVAAQPGDGLRTLVESNLLKGRELAKDMHAMMNATQVPRVVAQSEGAIGIVTASAIDSSVVELICGVQISQPLILVTIGTETPQVSRVVAAVSKLGN
jgi:phosphate transport system substrate-binding protein